MAQSFENYVDPLDEYKGFIVQNASAFLSAWQEKY